MKTTEEKLLDLGRWAILSGQVAGYLPLSISKDRAHGRFLHFRAVHLCPIYSLVFFLVILIWLILFMYNFSFTLKMQSHRLGSPFLGVTFCLSALISGIIVLLLKALGITQIPSFAAFWHKTVTSFEKLDLNESSSSRKLVNLDSKEFEAIFQDTRFRFLGYCTLIGIQLAMFDFRETLTTLFTKGGQIPLFNSTALAFTFFQILATFTHHGHPILIIFFIKLYKVTLAVGAEKLRNLSVVGTIPSKNGSIDKKLNNQISHSAFGELEYSIGGTTAFILSSQRNLNADVLKSPKIVLENIDKELEKIVDVIYSMECQIEFFNRMANWRITIEFIYQILFLVAKLASFIWIVWNGKLGFMSMLEPVIPIFLSISAIWCIASESEGLREVVHQLGVLLEKVPLQGVGWEMQQKIAAISSRFNGYLTGIRTMFFQLDFKVLTWISSWITLALFVLLLSV